MPSVPTRPLAPGVTGSSSGDRGEERSHGGKQGEAGRRVEQVTSKENWEGRMIRSVDKWMKWTDERYPPVDGFVCRHLRSRAVRLSPPHHISRSATFVQRFKPSYSYNSITAVHCMHTSPQLMASELSLPVGVSRDTPVWWRCNPLSPVLLEALDSLLKYTHSRPTGARGSKFTSIHSL